MPTPRTTPDQDPDPLVIPGSDSPDALRSIPARDLSACMLYAVANDENGNAVELTVYEDGRACSMPLTQPLIDQLVHLLTHPNQ